MKNMRKIDVSQKVIEKIRTGQVKMKSKLVFVLEKLGIKGAFGLLLIISILIISLIIFLIQQQSSSQFLGLGSEATFAFLSNLPWGWLLAVIIFLLLAAVILRKFTLAYRQTLKRSVINLTIIVILISSLFSLTGFHQGLAVKASELDNSLLKSVYRQALSCDFDKEHLLIGKVISIDKEKRTAEVVTIGHQSMTIQLFSDTKIVDAPKAGDIFGAVGYKEGSIFYAQGVRRVTLSALKNRCLLEGRALESQ